MASIFVGGGKPEGEGAHRDEPPLQYTLPYCNEASEERRAIQEFVKKRKRKEGTQRTVFGFASSDGPESINRDFTKRRVKGVGVVLRSRGYGASPAVSRSEDRHQSDGGKDELMDGLKLRYESLLCPRGWRHLRRLTGVVLSLGCLFLVGVLLPQIVVADAERQRDHQLKYEQKVQEMWDERAKSIDPKSWERYDACRKCVTRKPGYWKYEACYSLESGRPGDRLIRVGKAKCTRYSMWGNDRDSMKRHCSAQGYEGVDVQRLSEDHCAGQWLPGRRHGQWRRYIHDPD